MKEILTIFTLVSVCFWISCSKSSTENNSCFDGELKKDWADSTCSNLIKPVCGCNNVTYRNACEALKQGFDVRDSIPCGQ